MYRVVTVYFEKLGLGRKRVISKGPLHPDKERANRWAAYLRQAGDYYDVRVEDGSAANASHLNNHRTG